MAAIWSPTLLPTVRFEATNSSNGTSPPPPPPPPPPSPSPDNRNRRLIPRPLLSVSKPSWIVRTESNVRLERRKKPKSPCVVCKGSGRVDCFDCCGKGRTNKLQLAMLPKGEWPKWCRTCGGSGLEHCSRCLGTGKFTKQMGFYFTKRDADDTKVRKHIGARGNQHAFDVLLWDEQPNESSEK